MYRVTHKINGTIKAYTLGYYLPSRYGSMNPSSIKVHDYLLHTFKANKVNKTHDKFIELAAIKCFDKFKNYKIDFVIRALGSSELIPSMSKDVSINILGGRIAEKLNAQYKPKLLTSKRDSQSRQKLHFSGPIKNRPQIIEEDKLSFNIGVNVDTNDHVPGILIIDDITTSGSTAEGIVKAIQTFNKSYNIHFFALAETSSKDYVLDEHFKMTKERNDRLVNSLEGVLSVEQREMQIYLNQIDLDKKEYFKKKELRKAKKEKADQVRIEDKKEYFKKKELRKAKKEKADQVKMEDKKRREIVKNREIQVKISEEAKLKKEQERKRLNLLLDRTAEIDKKRRVVNQQSSIDNLKKQKAIKPKKVGRVKSSSDGFFDRAVVMIILLFLIIAVNATSEIQYEENLDNKEIASSNNNKKNRAIDDFSTFEKKLYKSPITTHSQKKLPVRKNTNNTCDPDNNFYPFEDSAYLKEIRSNFQSDRIIIYNINKSKEERWSIYLEATRFQDGKFKSHKNSERIIIRCFIDRNGKVISMKTLYNESGEYAKNQEAKNFIKRLKFSPGLKNGRSICMWVPVPIIISKRK